MGENHITTFTAYADIECYLEKTDTAPDKIQKHVPAAIGYIIISHVYYTNHHLLHNTTNLLDLIVFMNFCVHWKLMLKSVILGVKTQVAPRWNYLVNLMNWNTQWQTVIYVNIYLLQNQRNLLIIIITMVVLEASSVKHVMISYE